MRVIRVRPQDLPMKLVLEDGREEIPYILMKAGKKKKLGMHLVKALSRLLPR